jgi:hypothetical protein
MNPIAAIIAAFVALKADIKTRFNASLANLGPIEQVEGSNSVLAVIREVEWAQQRMEQIGTDLDATIRAAESKLSSFRAQEGEAVELAASRMLEAMLDEASQSAISKAIAAATHLPVEDHTTAIEQAVNSARETLRTELETAFLARLENVKLLATRREEAVAALGATAAALLTDDQLADENHAATVGLLAARIGRMKELGITEDARPVGFRSLLACGLDESGTGEFEARVTMIQESVQASVSLTASTQATPATTTPAIASGTEAAKRTAVI